MQMGHMPLIVLVSFTRVLVPTVDFPFKYELFFCTLSLKLIPSYFMVTHELCNSALVQYLMILNIFYMQKMIFVYNK